MAPQLSMVKSMLCGSGDTEPQSEVTAQLAQEIYNANLLEQLITDLPKIDFEVICLSNPLIIIVVLLITNY